MHRTSHLLAALLLAAACDNAASTDAAKPAVAQAGAAPASADAAKDAAAKPAAEPPATDAAKAAPADPWADKLAARVLADSGIGVGGKLSAFEIVNCESGEQYCQVCRFGGKPKIMAVGTSDDASFRKDLQDLDAIAQKYQADDLKAFAVITDIVDGKAATPADVEAAKTKAEALRKELNLTIPVVVPAPEDGGRNKVWDEYYNITQSRTVMFADGKNEVKYSAVGPEDWSALNAEISKVVGG